MGPRGCPETLARNYRYTLRFPRRVQIPRWSVFTARQKPNPWLQFSPFKVGFVVCIREYAQVFEQVLRFSPVSIIPPVIHVHTRHGRCINNATYIVIKQHPRNTRRRKRTMCRKSFHRISLSGLRIVLEQTDRLIR